MDDDSRLFATPRYRLSDADRSLVYEPAEDTFLLLDALEGDYLTLEALKPAICVEIGCGAGLVTSFVSRVFNGRCACFASDVVVRAAEVTTETAGLNSTLNVCPVVTSLLDAFSPRLFGKVDVLLFNPPYVPTSSAEFARARDVDKALAGGPCGRQVVETLLPHVRKFLSHDGLFYLIALKENDFSHLLRVGRQVGLDGEVCIERRCGREHLAVLKFRAAVTS